MMRFVVVGTFVAACGSAAMAEERNPLYPSITGGTLTAIGPTAPRTNPFGPRGLPATTFSTFTGVATAAGTLSFLESTAAPTADDIATIGDVNHLINQYVAAAGGIIRTVSATTSTDINGFDLLTVTISGRTVAGAPADLFPSGFVNSGNQATQGAIAFGLVGMPASLGGSVPFNTAPNNHVTAMTRQVITDGIPGPLFVVPPADYGNGPVNPWNGRLLHYFPGAATGNSVQSDVIYRITLVPTPGAAVVLGLGGLLAARRRRN